MGEIMKDIPAEHLKIIKDMTEQGFAATKISRKLCLMVNEKKTYPQPIVASIIKENNFEMMSKEFSEDEIPRIMELYRIGVSAKQLGTMYHIDKRRVIRWAKEEKMFRTGNEATRLRQVNEHIFDDVNSEEKAYWLGFLWADAYNCELTMAVRLGLQKDDLDHIKKFVQFMGGDPIDIEYSSSTNSYTYVVNSKYLSEKLASIGCMQAKSLIIKYPEWLDPKFDIPFIRGVFDGDGCLTQKSKIEGRGNYREWKFSIAGTKEMFQVMLEKFAARNISISLYHSAPDETTNTWVIETGGNTKVCKILDILYKDATIYLDRKLAKYLELKAIQDKIHPERLLENVISNEN
jgi:hypothetical protein